MTTATSNKSSESTTNREEVLANNMDYSLFSWSRQKDIDPIVVDHAEGVYLHDVNGKSYLDFSSGLINVNIGHGHPRIANAVIKQMQKVSYVTPSNITEVRGELAKKLASICPEGINKAFFTVCGATAIENAIKLARIVTGRHKIIGRYQSYHGSTYGVISAGGDPRRFAVDAQQAPNFIHIDIPTLYRWKYSEADLLEDCINQFKKTLAFENPASIAAILLEGESGSSGCLQYPKGYLRAITEICNTHGILVIIDEVMSGFGRTGKWFGFENHDIVPDMIAMAKGLTSGYLPMGCLMVKDSIVAPFDQKILPLGLTYSAHPVCCAAALETIRIYEDENLLENATVMGNYITAKVDALKVKHACIGEFRNTGLLGCLELVRNKTTKEPFAAVNAGDSDIKLMKKIETSLKSNGLYTMVRWNYIFIAPPLCITTQEADEGLAIISRALEIADEYIKNI
ncbi:MAG: aminotransferase class III-fold pyridoxal phosphate-dependent enzyme [Chitinophagaceae bacterium]|nr:MAG: aminotransferase class III-fold pyridoxal phosphate-dependent enzyme [Chitinophagaceae bacterium]